MRLPDRVTGLFLVGLGAAAAYGGWLLPPVPGQPVGPNVFPLVIGTGLALCGLAIAFGIGHSFEEEEELIPVEGGQRAAADRQALRPARPAAAGAAAVLRGGGRPARLHHHGSADRVRDVDRARRALEAVAAARRAGADRHSSDFLQAAARAARRPGCCRCRGDRCSKP